MSRAGRKTMKKLSWGKIKATKKYRQAIIHTEETAREEEANLRWEE